MGQPVLVKEIPFVKGVDEDLEKFKEKVHEVEWEAVIEGLQITIGEIRAKRSS